MLKTYTSELSWFEIMSKLVDPENPYIKEQPYKSNPEDKALKTKYFNPASEDCNWSRLKVANT